MVMKWKGYLRRIIKFFCKRQEIYGVFLKLYLELELEFIIWGKMFDF